MEEIKKQIGRITADIAGDSRYTQTLDVFLIVQGERLKIFMEVKDSTPNGGMDTYGSGLLWTTRATSTVEQTKDRASFTKMVLGIIKKTVGGPAADTIKAYGKPTKNFTWTGVKKKGISSSLLNEAISYALGETDDEDEDDEGF